VRSIRRELLVWLLLGIALAVAAAAVGTYWRARDEANALFDYQLKEMAASLTDAPFAGVPPTAAPGGPGKEQSWSRAADEPHGVLKVQGRRVGRPVENHCREDAQDDGRQGRDAEHGAR